MYMCVCVRRLVSVLLFVKVGGYRDWSGCMCCGVIGCVCDYTYYTNMLIFVENCVKNYSYPIQLD